MIKSEGEKIKSGISCYVSVIAFQYKSFVLILFTGLSKSDLGFLHETVIAVSISSLTL